MFKFLLILSLLTLALFSCSNDFASLKDETSSGISLYKPDGNPAVGALVQFFIVGDTSKQFVHQTQTDDNGNYSTEGVTTSNGSFNMLAQLGDSLVAFQDSVYITSSTHFVKDDTLGKPGSISGIVGLQPGHDSRTISVQALGTHIYTNVNSEGKFTLSGMAGGEYALRLATTLPEYTDTFCNVNAISDFSDTILDTLWLIYTGIPVVTGASATYDTLNGVVTLSWSKTGYYDFQDFLIYRDHYDSINPNPFPIASSIDTILKDTIFQASNIDTNDYRFKYRIKIRNNSLDIGNSYKFVDVLAVSPEKVKTTFTFYTKHIKTGLLTDSGSINDSIQIVTFFQNPTRKIKKISWAVENIDSIKQVNVFEPINTQGTDTLVYFFDKLGNVPVFVMAEDDGGTIWIDTAFIYIVSDSPIPTASTPLPYVSINDTIQLQGNATDVFGTIVKWEWKLGENPWVVTSSGDTTILAPPTEQLYVCSLRVTDDDELFSVDVISVGVGIAVDVDGNIYHTIKIGNQVWTVENLRTTKYHDGTVISNVIGVSEWSNLNTGAFCYYNNDINNKEKYGALYNWYAVNSGKLAPKGWHVPSDTEWVELENYLIVNGYNWDSTTTGNKIGKSLAAKTDWNPPILPNPGNVGVDLSTNNSSGFSALPGGYRVDTGSFYGIGQYCSFWSTTIYSSNPTSAYHRFLSCGNSDFGYAYYDKASGVSVRLLLD